MNQSKPLHFRLFIIFGMINVTSLFIGCTGAEQDKNTAVKEEACSVQFANIQFTKSLNNEKGAISIENDRLSIASPAHSDYFNDPDEHARTSTAPVLLTKIDNTHPFTFQVRVTPTFKETYDAGAVYLYQSPDQWFKFAFEQDERMKKRIVTVRTIDTSDDNNHDVVDSTSVFMKISSDVKTIGFYYSLDKEKWQLVRLFKNNYPKKLWLGLSSQSPAGKGTVAAFDYGSLLQNSITDFRMGN